MDVLATRLKEALRITSGQPPAETGEALEPDPELAEKEAQQEQEWREFRQRRREDPIRGRPEGQRARGVV